MSLLYQREKELEVVASSYILMKPLGLCRSKGWERGENKYFFEDIIT